MSSLRQWSKMVQHYDTHRRNSAPTQIWCWQQYRPAAQLARHQRPRGDHKVPGLLAHWQANSARTPAQFEMPFTRNTMYHGAPGFPVTGGGWSKPPMQFVATARLSWRLLKTVVERPLRSQTKH
mmetsp:Transcript_39860/g.87005  ORF Transcript_39860/g.87005 Transcript_39860/m.87005 type:complete len:124 (-) Transcript_39860:529-900(-)